MNSFEGDIAKDYLCCYSNFIEIKIYNTLQVIVTGIEEVWTFGFFTHVPCKKLEE